jgi:hypothetical protein
LDICARFGKLVARIEFILKIKNNISKRASDDIDLFQTRQAGKRRRHFAMFLHSLLFSPLLFSSSFLVHRTYYTINGTGRHRSTVWVTATHEDSPLLGYFDAKDEFNAVSADAETTTYFQNSSVPDALIMLSKEVETSRL